MLLGATAVALDLPAIVALALLAGVGIHGLARRPRTPRRLVLEPDGTWSIPEQGQWRLQLAPGTAWAAWYVELVLAGAARAPVRVLILRDQLDADAWRRLQVAVRERGGAGI